MRRYARFQPWLTMYSLYVVIWLRTKLWNLPMQSFVNCCGRGQTLRGQWRPVRYMSPRRRWPRCASTRMSIGYCRRNPPPPSAIAVLFNSSNGAIASRFKMVPVRIVHVRTSTYALDARHRYMACGLVPRLSKAHRPAPSF